MEEILHKQNPIKRYDIFKMEAFEIEVYKEFLFKTLLSYCNKSYYALSYNDREGKHLNLLNKFKRFDCDDSVDLLDAMCKFMSESKANEIKF